MAIHDPTVGVTADLTVRVPLGASGTLVEGVARVLERTDRVRAVDDAAVTGVTPGLNDTAVDATVTVTVDTDDAAGDAALAARDALADGFGVEAVEAVELTGRDPPDAGATAGG